MSAMQMLTGYSTPTAAKVAVLLALVLALRLVIVPFALIAVLLDRAQGSLSGVVAAMPTHSIPTNRPASGGEAR